MLICGYCVVRYSLFRSLFATFLCGLIDPEFPTMPTRSPLRVPQVVGEHLVQPGVSHGMDGGLGPRDGGGQQAVAVRARQGDQQVQPGIMVSHDDFIKKRNPTNSLCHRGHRLLLLLRVCLLQDFEVELEEIRGRVPLPRLGQPLGPGRQQRQKIDELATHLHSGKKCTMRLNESGYYIKGSSLTVTSNCLPSLSVWFVVLPVVERPVHLVRLVELSRLHGGLKLGADSAGAGHPANASAGRPRLHDGDSLSVLVAVVEGREG